MLADLNYRASHVRTAEAAREQLDADGGFALLLCDVALPGGQSGAALAAEIRQDHPDLKLVFMSGHPADSAGDSATWDLGAAFLPKPFRRQKLAQVLAETLATPPKSKRR